MLAAIGPIAGFIGMSLFGISMFGVTVRTGVGIGLAQAIVGYGFALGFVFVMALIIDALAGSFGGEKNPVQALKTAAYASTAAWLFGIFQLLPALGLLALVGVGLVDLPALRRPAAHHEVPAGSRRRLYRGGGGDLAGAEA